MSRCKSRCKSRFLSRLAAALTAFIVPACLYAQAQDTQVQAQQELLERTQRALAAKRAQSDTGPSIDLNGVELSSDALARTRDAMRRAQAAQSTTQSIPDIQLEPRPIEPIDIAALARSMPSTVPANMRDKPQGPLVFVSLSMPAGSLKKLATDAKRVNATLVIRGMVDGSLRKTTQALLDYSRQGVNLVIDPQAFKRYGVSVVPAFVVDVAAASPSCQGDTACSIDRSVLVEGDVSLAHALRAIESRSSSRVKDAAANWIKLIEG